MKYIRPLFYEIKLQFRGGFYFAYIFVTILYIAFLRSIPSGFKDILAVFIIYSDPSIITFYFVAGMILLEKNEKTLDSVFLSSMSINLYLINKVLSLGAISLFTSFVIITASYGFDYNPFMLCIAVILSSAFYTLAGIAISVKSPTINRFIYPSIGFVMLFTLPAVNYIPQIHFFVFEYLPAMSIIRLLDYSLRGEFTFTDSLINSLYGFSMVVLAFIFARYRFKKYINEKIGGVT